MYKASTLALGDVLLLSAGRWTLALLYLVLSLAGGMLAVLSGQWFGQALINVGRRSKKEVRVPVIAPDPKTPETSRRAR